MHLLEITDEAKIINGMSVDHANNLGIIFQSIEEDNPFIKEKIFYLVVLGISKK